MADPKQKTEPPVLPGPARAGRTAPVSDARRLVILIFAFWVSVACQAADSYSTVIHNHLALETEALSEAGETPDAADSKVADLKRALALEAQMLPQAPQAPPPPATSQNHNNLILAALLIAAALAIGKFIHLLSGCFNFWNPLRAVEADPSRAVLEEDPSLVAFLMELRDGLSPQAAQPAAEALAPLNGVGPETGEDRPRIVADSLQEFFDSAPGQLTSFRALFSEISRAPDDAARQQIVLKFLHQVRGLKESSQMPGLLPVWLMSCALEGLLKQLSNNASDVTLSVLGTAAGAVDLLEALCTRSLKPNLATEPPVRLLAVDDDAASRLAISFALKKAFNEPDLAPDGEAALALAARQTYDVIFLEVEMPGMDGFELCKKIHETVHNRTTPVVFVTRQSDFTSRAKSTLSGGKDLIAKPYLAFEITVKALTLALRARLQNGAAKPRSASEGRDRASESRHRVRSARGSCSGSPACHARSRSGRRTRRKKRGTERGGKASPGP